MENVKNRIMRDLYSAAILGIELSNQKITKEDIEKRIEKLAENFITETAQVAPIHESQVI
ncbi:MAG: hypothetical protein CV087_17435 [Candidatus Brocadia sp. WS118]|nr:MAG: hypothetical protein CV087_17435 [Candidatus Brocadia sp. WS118]